MVRREGRAAGGDGDLCCEFLPKAGMAGAGSEVGAQSASRRRRTTRLIGLRGSLVATGAGCTPIRRPFAPPAALRLLSVVPDTLASARLAGNAKARRRRHRIYGTTREDYVEPVGSVDTLGDSDSCPEPSSTLSVSRPPGDPVQCRPKSP